MAEKNYAFIKDGNVVNIAVFDDPSEELLGHFIAAHEVDDIVLTTDKSAIGGTYDGAKFWLPKPFPSWVKDEAKNEWKAPVALPADAWSEDNTDGKLYTWDEDSTSWVEVEPAQI